MALQLFAFFMAYGLCLGRRRRRIRELHCPAIVVFIDRSEGKSTTSKSIDAVVSGNREEPRCKGPPVVVAMQMLKSSQESLLGGIFSGLSFAEHAVAQVIDMHLVRLHELREGFLAAMLSLCD